MVELKPMVLALISQYGEQIKMIKNIAIELGINDYDKFAIAHRYQAQILDDTGKLVSNPQTKEQFFEEQIGLFVQRSIYSVDIETSRAISDEQVIIPPIQINGKPIDLKPIAIEPIAEEIIL